MAALPAALCSGLGAVLTAVLTAGAVLGSVQVAVLAAGVDWRWQAEPAFWPCCRWPCCPWHVRTACSRCSWPLHLLLKLAELVLHLAEDIVLVLQLLPELKLLPVPKLYLTLEVLYLCIVFWEHSSQGLSQRHVLCINWGGNWWNWGSSRCMAWGNGGSN